MLMTEIYSVVKEHEIVKSIAKKYHLPDEAVKSIVYMTISEGDMKFYDILWRLDELSKGRN